MMMSLILTFIITLFHPLHVSVTEIEYDERERELEIVSRIFTDDLETAIRASRNLPELDLLNPPSGLTTTQLAQEYVLARLKIVLDGKSQKLSFLGVENDGEALVCYVQVKDVKKWKSITVTNAVLLETFDDQSNLVHVTLAGKVRSLRLMPSKPSGTLTF
jgi:hypothetical protein